MTAEAQEVTATQQTRTAALISGAIGWISAIAPHILHHAGLLVATAFVAGATGLWVFGAIALVAVAPVLIRLRRRTNSWLAPAGMLALMLAMFSVSRLMMG